MGLQDQFRLYLPIQVIVELAELVKTREDDLQDIIDQAQTVLRECGADSE